jgi:hypothetical protein
VGAGARPLAVAAGISGADYRSATDLTEGFRTALLVCAALSAAGGLLALATVRRPAGPAAEVGVEPVLSCPIGAPTLGQTPTRAGRDTDAAPA